MGSLSYINIEKAERIHQRVRLELGRSSLEMNKFTSQLPQDKQRQGAHTAIVDTEMLLHLLQAGVINQWEGTWLTPIQTIGDGNCLLHAVSLYMWGVQDKNLSLRRHLDRTMQEDGGELYERWAHQRRTRDAAVPGVPFGGVNYEPGQWDGEWDTMIQMASAAPNEGEPNQTRYRPLEEFHIFVLANILRRPIVVFADTSVRDDEGNSWAPIPFGGIYLPLLHAPAECVRCPILLGYSNQHFAPLLTTQTPAQHGASPSTQHPPQTISLMRQTGERLPVQYILPAEEGRDVLAEYLIIPAEDSSDGTLLAALDIVPLPDHLNLFKDFVERDWEGTPQQRNASPTLSSFQKPVSVVRPLAKALSKRPMDNTTHASESMPVPCTEDVDGSQAGHSPLDESLLRMKLCQGEQTATVVNLEQLRSPPSDNAAASVPPLPIQENIAPLSNENYFEQSQHPIAGPSGTSSSQPRRSAPPSPPQGNMAYPLNVADTGRSQVQQHVASEECQRSNGMTMQDIHRIPNGRNENSQNDESVSATCRPSYAAAVKSNPGPVTRQSAPKPKLFSTPPKKSTCKNPECKGSPCPQNGGYCAKCHRKNSAEKRRERRESLASLQGNTSRAGTPVHIGRAVNQKHKQKGSQTTKPKRPETAVASSSSLVVQKSQQQQARGKSTGRHSDRNTQRSASPAPPERYSHETPPSKVVEASSNPVQPPMQAKRSKSSIPGNPASLTGTNATYVPSQVQLPGSAQCPDLGGICKTAACSGLGLPQAGGLCLDCWSKQEGAASTNIQQSHAANCRAQDRSRAPRNNYKEAKRKANLPASRNGGIHTRVPAQHTCTAPGCEGVVDEHVHATLCPECFSHLERRNSGGVADSRTGPNPSMSAPSPAHDQPAARSAGMYFTQEPTVQRCVTKGCKRSATRENGYYCCVHNPRGNPQQGRQQSHHQVSTNNSQSQQLQYSQPPSISSIAPISLTFNGTVEHLHVHHHYPSQDVPQSNGTGGLESQLRSPFSAQEAPQSGLRASGTGHVPGKSNGFPSHMHNNGAAAPVSGYGPVCPKCGKPGNAWFNDLCLKCQQQQQK